MRVAVLGVGLIGGSIGLAARRRAHAHVIGYDADADVRARAHALGAIEDFAEDVQGAVEGADIVFAATPVAALPGTVTAALAAAPHTCVVSDVGSTKRLLEGVGSDERFIGGHPLAGAESAGVEHAREDLFDGAIWYLTPSRGSTAGVLFERLHRFLAAIGARPTAIDAATHDRLMACVSHLPHVLANALVGQAAGVLGSERAETLPAVGPSFRSATRVAGASSSIWTDIYMSNGDAIASCIDELLAHLHQVRGWLAARDADAVAAWNERARSQREALLGAELVGAPVHELRVSVPNRPGVIAEIALALGGEGVNIADMALSPSPDNRQGVVALWISGGRQHTERAHELIANLGFPVVQP